MTRRRSRFRWTRPGRGKNEDRLRKRCRRMPITMLPSRPTIALHDQAGEPTGPTTPRPTEIRNRLSMCQSWISVLVGREIIKSDCCAGPLQERCHAVANRRVFGPGVATAARFGQQRSWWQSGRKRPHRKTLCGLLLSSHFQRGSHRVVGVAASTSAFPWSCRDERERQVPVFRAQHCQIAERQQHGMGPRDAEKSRRLSTTASGDIAIPGAKLELIDRPIGLVPSRP